tara:strand:+ start:934 stop:1545 length:612 start_codon:yes stop_codon:yes gene_type:complete
MNDKLCDRCLGCSYQILDTFDIKENIQDFNEFKTQILNILEIISEDNGNSIISEKLWDLNYEFLRFVCTDCINKNSKKAVDFIKIYIKFLLLIKMFDMIVTNDLNKRLFDNITFCNTFKRKLLAVQFSKRDNYHMKRFYNSSLVKDDFSNITYDFEILDKINEYYEYIYKIPIYLANFNAEQYCERKKLNLCDKIKNHPLVLN